MLRWGARKLLAQAVEAEVADFLTAHADLTTADGRQRLVRHGHLPERTIQTGIGFVEVQQPRVRDRGSDGEKIRFSPAIEEPECLDPDPLSARQGGFQPVTGRAGRLKASWKEEFERWQQRDLSARRYVYIWADGVYLQARMEVEKQCISAVGSIKRSTS